MDCSRIESIAHRMQLDDLLPKGTRFPIGGGLALTSKCNLRCVHCYDRCEQKQDPLDEAQWLTLINQLEQAGVLFIYLTGGEPTLHPAFCRIYRELKERGFLVEVLTNGTCLSEEILSLFEEYPPLEVEVSIYGASMETYQAVTGAGKLYFSFCQGIEELHRRGIPFRLKTVLLRENIQDFEAMRNVANKYDVPFFYALFPFLRLDGNRDPLAHGIDEDVLLKILSGDAQECAFLKQCAQEAPPFLLHLQNMESPPLYLCNCGNYSFFITAQGILQGCTKSKLFCSNLREVTFAQGWELLGEIRRMTASQTYPCARCKDIVFCDRCAAENAAFAGDTQSEEPALSQCAMAKIRRQLAEIVQVT